MEWNILYENGVECVSYDFSPLVVAEDGSKDFVDAADILACALDYFLMSSWSIPAQIGWLVPTVSE